MHVWYACSKSLAHSLLPLTINGMHRMQSDCDCFHLQSHETFLIRMGQIVQYDHDDVYHFVHCDLKHTRVFSF